jgi:hypothetical protein
LRLSSFSFFQSFATLLTKLEFAKLFKYFGKNVHFSSIQQFSLTLTFFSSINRIITVFSLSFNVKVVFHLLKWNWSSTTFLVIFWQHRVFVEMPIVLF